MCLVLLALPLTLTSHIPFARGLARRGFSSRPLLPGAPARWRANMSTPPRSRLLALDAIINVGLGLLLLARPGPTIRALGLPPAEPPFYATVLGAVLLGIGLALYIERQGIGPGLGLPGAIIINMFGAGSVLAWLLWGGLDLPLRGAVTLWLVALIVLATGIVELATGLKHRR